MTTADRAGEPPFDDFDLGAAEPPPTAGAAGGGAGAVRRTAHRQARPAKRLFLGQTAIDFWGHRRTYFAISLLLIVISVISLAVRHVNLGIEFEGGVAFDVPAGEMSGRRGP